MESIEIAACHEQEKEKPISPAFRPARERTRIIKTKLKRQEDEGSVKFILMTVPAFSSPRRLEGAKEHEGLLMGVSPS